MIDEFEFNGALLQKAIRKSDGGTDI